MVIKIHKTPRDETPLPQNTTATKPRHCLWFRQRLDKETSRPIIRPSVDDVCSWQRSIRL